MEYLTHWEFWREVALTVAARLSVIAAALWAVKMVTDRLAEKSGAALQPAAPTGAISRTTMAPSSMSGGSRIENYTTQKPHRRALTLKGTKATPAAEAGIWREKMAKYLTGEPTRAGKALQR